MKSDSIAFAISGILFGLIAGWIIGSQQAIVNPREGAPQTAAPAEQATTASVPPLDEAKVKAFSSVAEREPSNAAPRIELGKLYLEAERYDDAIKWYDEALKLSPKDADVSTDLGFSYYNTNQADKALEQFDHSLKLNPKHVRTFLYIGIVKAFGKQDLDGAMKAWEQAVALAPDSREGQAAKRAIDSLGSAHPPGQTPPTGG